MNDKLNKIQQEKRTAQIMVAICAAGLIVSLILTRDTLPSPSFFTDWFSSFTCLFSVSSPNDIKRL